MEIKKINIIGFGNVGQILFNHLKNKVIISSIYTRNLNKELLELTDKIIINDFNKISKNVDLNIVAVKDDAIAEVISKLSKNVPVVHTSGGISIEVLKSFELYGILYPLQTFSKNTQLNLAEIPFFIETNTKKFTQELEIFSKKFLSKNTIEANSDKRKYIHLSAIITSNFLTYFLVVAEEILKEKNLTLEILRPLLEETLKKSMKIGPINSITGPASRGDFDLIQDYSNMLNDESFKKLFLEINNRISLKEFNVLES